MVSTCVLPAPGVKSREKVCYFVGTQSSSRDNVHLLCTLDRKPQPLEKGRGGSPGGDPSLSLSRSVDPEMCLAGMCPKELLG